MSSNIKTFYNTCKDDPLTLLARFLLVSLNIDAILGEVTINKRRKKLEEMTKGKGLGDAYTATLSRIRSQNGSKSRLGMEALMWISHSERPLKALELCQALGVETGDTDQNAGDIPAIETVLRCSLGLVMIEESSSTVRLVHFTLQEHLFNDPSLFPSPHSMMAEICLTFLNFRCIRGLSTALNSPPVEAPFVGYASCYWGAHARKELSERVRLLALKLLDGYDKHVSSKLLLIHERDWWWHISEQKGSNSLEGFTGLHGAAYLGIVEIARALLGMREWDLNAVDVGGNTAFSWAARKGHEDVVKMLLARQDVDPDTTNADGRTPLFWAAACGHMGVVEMLLERTDVDSDRRDKYGQTPLFRAAWAGNEGVAKILLEHGDVNPSTVDNGGQAPLFGAACEGHEGVVKMLLERRDINPNTADEYGQTPLLIAGWEGHEGVAKILLERRDVNPNTPDKYGQTPLFVAAWKGHEGVAKALLERNDVNPNTINEHGQTPLFIAAREGNERVVKMLLERVDVNSDMADLAGQTSLSQALKRGHDSVVKLLSESPSLSSDRSKTLPLSLRLYSGPRAKYGHSW